MKQVEGVPGPGFQHHLKSVACHQALPWQHMMRNADCFSCPCLAAFTISGDCVIGHLCTAESGRLEDGCSQALLIRPLSMRTPACLPACCACKPCLCLAGKGADDERALS